MLTYMSFSFHSNASLSFSSKVCYIKFQDSSSVGVAQHLTNTVFIDRALIVVPCAEGELNPSSTSRYIIIRRSAMHRNNKCNFFFFIIIIDMSQWWRA